MRRFIVLLTLALIALAVVYRNRLFLRDPLGKLERNGAPGADARIFINYSNDVLVQQDGGRRMFVVQNINKLPGSPTGLTCIQGLLCVTPSDIAVQAVEGTPEPGRQATMSDREVSFTDDTGALTHVQLR